MKHEAVLNGFDDAVSLDAHGHVAESTVANIFLVKDGRLITPDASTDILEGITRHTIFKLATQYDIEVIQRTIDRSELYLADEMFLSGSSMNVTPVISIDHRAIGSGHTGKITSQLMKAYDDVARGKNDNFKQWLTILKPN